MPTARRLFGWNLNEYLIAMWLTNLVKIKKRSCALTHWAVLVEEGYNILQWRYVNKEVAVLGLWWARLDSNINSIKKPSKQNLQLISGADPPQAFRAAETVRCISRGRLCAASSGEGRADVLGGNVQPWGCGQVWPPKAGGTGKLGRAGASKGC